MHHRWSGLSVMLLSTSLLLSCSSTSPVAPQGGLPASADTVPVAVVEHLTSGIEQPVALYHLRIEPETLAVQVENVTERALQASPQAKHYDLELWGAITDGQGNPFLTIRGAQQFNVTGVVDLPGIGLQVNFSHKHPLNAPNYTSSTPNALTACEDCLCYSDVPPSPIRPSARENCLRGKAFGTVRPNAINRSDLSYAGRAVFLANVPGDTRTFFGNVNVDVAGAYNPQGYVDARSIINATGDTRHPGLTNTVFPYVLLADEAKNNRTGVSNSGNMTGNYDAAGFGWQRSNVGTSYTGWTGYDLVHAGQTVTNSIILKQVPGGGYDGYVALVVKYTDPRGKSSLYWRWPTPTPDPIQFAYRMPFGALDASVVLPPDQPVNIGAAAGSTAQVTVRVRDWDRTATAHTGFDLSGQTNVSLVQQGAPGNCTVSLSVPGLTATEVALTYQTGSGLPNQESQYSGTVTNTLGTAPAGPVLGLVRVVDPENSDTNAGSYRFGIDNPPTYTNAQPAKALPIVTYQVVPFNVTLSRPVISAVTPSGCPTPAAGKTGEGAIFKATASNNPTAWSWNFGGGATPNTSTEAEPLVSFTTPGTFNGTVTATNAAGASTPFPFCFVVTQEAPEIQFVLTVCPMAAGVNNQTGVTFRAIATGGPTSYSWDFGPGAVITGGGTTATVTVTLGSAGEYTGSVNATNGAGTSPDFTFCYKVDS